MKISTRDDNEKIFRTRDSVFSNDDISFNVSIECGDMNILGSLEVKGNVNSRCIWLNGLGSLEILGNLNSSVKGEVKANSVFILGNCSCRSITSDGPVMIGGDCSCNSIISSTDDIIIDGNFTGDINELKAGENHHVYIAGKCVK